MELFSIKIRCTFQLVSTPLSYADYYYVEALMRLRNQLKNKSL